MDATRSRWEGGGEGEEGEGRQADIIVGGRTNYSRVIKGGQTNKKRFHKMAMKKTLKEGKCILLKISLNRHSNCRMNSYR